MSSSPLPLAIVAASISADPRQAAAGARARGFSGIEFDAFSPALDLTELSQTGRREFRHLLSSNDQTLVALTVDAGVKGFSPGADVDRLLSRLSKAMDAAKAIAITPLVCLDIGAAPEPASTPKPTPRVTGEQAGLIIIPELSAPPTAEPARPAPDAAVVSQIDGALSELGRLADRIGATLALRSDLASYAALDRALSAAACPWFGVDLDPVAILRDEWTSDEIFSRLGPLIRHVRARDAVAGANKRTQAAPIGRGSTNWLKFLSDLDSAGYRGWLTVDSLELPDRLAAAVEGARFCAQ